VGAALRNRGGRLSIHWVSARCGGGPTVTEPIDPRGRVDTRMGLHGGPELYASVAAGCRRAIRVRLAGYPRKRASYICGAQDEHQPAAFTCLPVKIWHGPVAAPALP
jgi:hypothetical protein